MAQVYFDLDYTLYDQGSYIRQAFASIVRHLKRPSWERTLTALWRSRGTRHPSLFDDFLREKGLHSRQRVATCVRIFHDPHPLTLRLYADVAPTLSLLRGEGHALGLVTDGYVAMQRRKFRELGLSRFFKPGTVRYAVNGGKHVSGVFRDIARKSAGPGRDLWYVGDNPRTDFIASKRAGFTTVRIMRGEYRTEPSPASVDYEIDSLRELPKLLSKRS